MFKIHYLLVIALLTFLGTEIHAQNAFFENFNGGNALNNWTLIDVDGRTPAAQISYITDAWVIREDFDTTGVGDSAAISTSYYIPAGAASDYMITPMIITGTSPILEFDAKAQDPIFPDGYELLISTTSPSVAGLGQNPPLLVVPAENGAWTRRRINLASYAKDTIYIGWRNNSNDDYLLLIDNVRVYNAPLDDAALAQITLGPTVSTNPTTVSGIITNSGLDTLNSVIVNYSVNNGPVNSDTISINVATGDSAAFNHRVAWTPTGLRSYSELKMWTTMPNGNTDVNPSNDTLSADLWVNLGANLPKTTLFELFTTAVCRFCPDGIWISEQIENNYLNVATVSIHSCTGSPPFHLDGMTNDEADSLCSAFGVPGAPIGMVDRKLFPFESNVAFSRGTTYPNWQQNLWARRSLSQTNDSALVDVNLTGLYDPITKIVNVDVSSTFVDYVLPEGDISISLMVIEDSVVGSGSFFYQRNAYNFQTGHPFAGKGDPVLNYPHRRVMRDISPYVWGDTTIVPSNYSLNTNYSRNFSFSLDTAWDESQISLIGIVAKYGGANIANYEVLNVVELKLGLLTSMEERSVLTNSLNIYPNPSDLPFTNVEFFMENSANVQARITDVTGEVVSIEDFGTLTQGNQRIQLNTRDLENGFYFVNLKVGEYEVSRKISILK